MPLSNTVTTCRQSTLMTGHNARRISHRGKVNVTPANQKQCSRLHRSIFCCVHCSNNLQCFSISQTTPAIARFPWGIWTQLIHGSLGPTVSAPKWHLDQLSHFCAAHVHDHRQTDTQTDHTTPSAATGRI